jgi:putative NADPH-quinone reductase
VNLIYTENNMNKKTLVVVAHPDISRSRINRTWIDHLRPYMGKATVHELYKAYPDGKIDVAAEQRLLEKHDRIILQFPMFWFSTPALLKQWLDDVLSYGWAFGPGGDKLEGKEIGVAVSTGGPAHAYQAGAQNQYTLSEVLRPLQMTAQFTRARYLPVFAMQGALYEPTEEELRSNAQAYVRHVLGEAA